MSTKRTADDPNNETPDEGDHDLKKGKTDTPMESPIKSSEKAGQVAVSGVVEKLEPAEQDALSEVVEKSEPAEQDALEISGVVEKSGPTAQAVATDCATTLENYFRAAHLLCDVSADSLLAAIKSSSLKVQTEQDVLEMLVTWLDCQKTEDAETVDVVRLLKMIRWCGVSQTYIQKRLLKHLRLMIDPAVCAYLQQVLIFFSTGIPFPGLITDHRLSTGKERCAIVFGVCTEFSATSESMRLSLQRSASSLSESIDVKMSRGAAACVNPLTNTLYVTGIGDTFNEIWKWESVSGWTRCGTLQNARQRHCTVFISPSSVITLTGISGSQPRLLLSIERFDINRKTCLYYGNVVYAVESAACCTDKGIIYLFGGKDLGKSVKYIQAFNTLNQSSFLFGECLPRSAHHLRAVTWNHHIFLLGYDTCMVFDVEAKTFRSRNDVRTGKRHFGSFAENGRIYLVGGGTRHNDGEFSSWTFSDQILSLGVEDLLEIQASDVASGQSSELKWKLEKSRLPMACFVCAFGCVTCEIDTQ